MRAHIQSLVVANARKSLRISVFRKYSSDSSNSSTKKSDKLKQPEEVKKAILDEALEQVHLYGWTTEAVSASAEAFGYPGTAHGLFPDPGSALAFHLYRKSNIELAKELQKWSIQTSTSRTNFVESALKYRLSLLIPYHSVWEQGLGILSSPRNVARTGSLLLEMADEICHQAGDRAVDMSWYSKRLGLMGVYQLSELYFLQDQSPVFVETWDFLSRRVQDFNALQELDKMPRTAADLACSFFHVAKNIMKLY